MLQAIQAKKQSQPRFLSQDAVSLPEVQPTVATNHQMPMSPAFEAALEAVARLPERIRK